MEQPVDILRDFPVRKTRQQKQAFRQAVSEYASGLGYPVREEKGSFGCRNLVLGDPEKASYLITAHYDTCARLPVPNLITPCNLLPFLAYQIFLTAVIVTAPIALGMAAGYLSKDPQIAGVVTYLGVLAALALMLIGPANPSNANDNTSGVVTVLEIARTLPQSQREKVCFVLFDLEEAGLIGSAAYRKAHKQAAKRQLVLNLDCVGEGDHLRMFPTKALKKDPARLSALNQICGYFGAKSLLIRDKGFAIYPSDQKNFPLGVGICALNKSRFGLYLGKIHTSKDTVLDQTNVNLLRAALTTYICRNAGQ